MNRAAVTVAIGFLAALSSAAVAADLPAPQIYRKAPASRQYVAPFTWQGLYLGFNGGYGWADSTLSSSSAADAKIQPQGALLGSTFGYNFSADNIVYGIEADVDYSWMRAANGTTPTCASCEVRNFYLGTARARVGYAVGRWLTYLTGGAAFGNIRVVTPSGSGQIDDKIGWTAGAGVEYAVAGTPWSAKLEYLYADLGKSTCDAAHCGTSTDASFQANIVRLGLNYHY